MKLRNAPAVGIRRPAPQAKLRFAVKRRKERLKIKLP
jgi:hypothetical protein